MSKWSGTKAKQVLKALQNKGWTIKRQSGSHKILEKSGWNNVVFAFHDGEEIGPKMLTRIAKLTGLSPDEL
ncbi:type II toxin-antitoxin system HicA family toxin [Geminocystis sp.]|uniref:type II toxin-antitoxin system HicA family toxin n=1 Tax=Geminocystis sp. TaxID=2664100 RepID=UPI003593B2B7